MDRRHFNAISGAAALFGGSIVWPDRASAQTGGRGGTLHSIINPEPAQLVMGLSTQAQTLTVGGKIYQGLLTYTFDLKPLPALAEKWERSPDGLRYTFKLRRGVKWHDGTPFSSADVVFSMTKILPMVAPRARMVLSRCESISATDEHTVVFKLKAPFAPFLGAFDVGTMPILPKHLYGEGDFKTLAAGAKPIGTGPFKFKAWERGSYIHLVRNPDYYIPNKPHLDEIYYHIIPDAALRSSALSKGTVKLSAFNDIEPFEVSKLRANPKLVVTTKGYELFAPLLWLEINNRHPLLSRKPVRQALAHAIDRNFIRDRIWFGLGRVATGPINSVTRFYDKNVRNYPFSVAEATKLLDEAGVRPKAGGSRAELKLLIAPFGEVWLRLAEYVRQALSRIGITVTLDMVDVATFGQRVGNWDYDITFNFLFQYGDPALGVARTYLSNNITKGVLFSNTQGYSNPEVDRLFEAASVSLDDQERQRLYSAVQKQLVEDLPLLWLLEMEFPTIHSADLVDVVTTGGGVNDSFENARFI